jgi:predicted DNA-binding protein (MmcQ/YjbR family)
VAKNITQAVREVCLSFPEAEEVLSHGQPNFRVRGGKTFAMYTVNHHGDGRIALWLSSPPGAQEIHTKGEPKHFFVPPYVGPKGWLGVHLDKGLSWKRIAVLVREAYEKVAPPKLAAQIGKTIEIKPPTAKLAATEIDPMKSKRAQSVLKRLREIGHRWPSVEDGTQFGSPVLKAGERTFASAYYNDKRLTLCFWVGVDKQSLLTADERFSIPKYIGHNGWIQLDVEKSCDWDEIRVLALESYRHFASKKMLAAMEPSAGKRTS